MNMIQGSIYFVSMFSVVVCSAASGDLSRDTMKQKLVDPSLNSSEIKQSLGMSLTTAKNAQQEMAEFQTKVEKGDIPKANNNGVWCAVFYESKTVTKLATYASKDGPMTCFMKTVYSEADHKARINESGYRLTFSANGMVIGYMRADLQEIVEYHQNGQIKSFSHKISNGWYTAKWDEKNGKLLSESSSMGTMNNHRTDKDKVDKP